MTRVIGGLLPSGLPSPPFLLSRPDWPGGPASVSAMRGAPSETVCEWTMHVLVMVLSAANAGHIFGVGALPRLPITRARGRICRAFSGTRWACLTGRRGGKRAMGHTSPIGTLAALFPTDQPAVKNQHGNVVPEGDEGPLTVPCARWCGV